MKKLTLDDVIAEHYQGDPEFRLEYDKELLINAISKMVVTLRQNSQLTHAELALRAQTTQPVIARLESGTDHRLPSLALLFKIAEAANAKLNINFEL